MKIALISDIHGNLTALDTILADLQQHHIDKLICLGDVSSGGPQPREVLQRLRELACPIVMGNTDAWLLEPKITQRQDEWSQKCQDIDLWCSQQLSSDDKAFIQSFKPTIEVPLGGNHKLLCYHGSPRSFHEIILSTTPDESIDEFFADVDATICVGGHTHLQLFRRYRDKLLLNPGSVGLTVDRAFPREEMHNAAWGEYAILQVEEGHHLNVELYRVPFDLDAFFAVSQQSGMPHADWAENQWVR